MIHDLLPINFVSQLIEPIRLLEDGIVNFKSANTEIVEGLEKIAIEVVLDLTSPFVVASYKVMNYVVRFHFVDVPFDEVVLVYNEGLLADILATSLVAHHVHIQAQVGI